MRVEKGNAIERDFRFNDMYDMYNQTLYVCEKHYEPSIVLFYEAEERLRDYMKSAIEEIDFKYNKKLLDVLVMFVEESMVYNVRGAVLGNLSLYTKGKKMTDIISGYIKDSSYNWVEKYERNELEHGIMTPYVVLYKMIKKEKNLLDNYNECVEELKNHK